MNVDGFKSCSEVGPIPRPRLLRSWRLVCAALLAPVGLLLLEANGQVSEGETPVVGKHYAILIGIEKYQQPELELAFTLNDVDQIAGTLEDVGGYQVWRFTEKAGWDREPTRENLMAELPKLIKQPGAQDTLIVYFTGHGFLGADRKLYLAPIDCDADDASKTGLPVAWLRDQLAGCRARFKLLVLDACHAGTAKGRTPLRSVPAKDLAASFEETPGLYTLASCLSEEKSLLWEAKRQSLFSYWVNQGLRGHADHDGDGGVTADELFRFVMLHVPRVAESVFQRNQHPDRIVGPEASQRAVILEPTPQTLRGLLADMAEQLATLIQLQGLKVVGVPELTVDAKKRELELGADFGVLGRYCATELTGLLAMRSAGQFQVVTEEALQERLQACGVTCVSIRTGAIEQLSVGQKPVSALILGVLRSRVGRRVTIQCELLGTKESVILGAAGGEALLNENEWAMLGRSVEVTPADYRPEQGRSVADSLIERLDFKTGHPMQDASFPYRVYVVLNGYRRPGKFLDHDLYVPLRKGEVYSIHIELGHRVQQPVLMRLLVDGLSTLPEPAQVRRKGAFVEPIAAQPAAAYRTPTATPEHEYLPAQRMNLDETSTWKLDPLKSHVFVVPGFVVDVGTGKYRDFKVVDVQDLPAARRDFTDQLGLITAAFYKPKPSMRDSGGSRGRLATAPGDEHAETFETFSDLEPDRLLAVIHVRYIDAEAWKRLPAEPVSLDERPSSSR